MEELSATTDSTPLRILYLVFNRTGRGTYWRALGFGEALARRGHQVTLLSAGPAADETSADRSGGTLRRVQLPDLHRGSGYDPWHTMQRMRWLQTRGREARFDLAHLFETRPVNLLPGLLLRRRHGVPLFTDWCDWFGRGGSVEERSNPLLRTILRPVETFFEDRFRREMAGATVINSILLQKALALGVDPETILLLPNGANVEQIRPQPREEVRRRLGLPVERRYLAYTGSIFRRDAHLMAQAFDLISEANPNVSLLMIGYCNISLRDLVQHRDAVVESGAINYQKLADYVAAADVGWLPLSDSGANRGRFPMKAHDFIAAGRPLLVSNVGDLGSFVSQYDIGRVAAAGAEAQARAALSLLQDDGAMVRLGHKARQAAVEKRSWPVVAASLEAYYGRQLARSHAQARREDPWRVGTEHERQ